MIGTADDFIAPTHVLCRMTTDTGEIRVVGADPRHGFAS